MSIEDVKNAIAAVHRAEAQTGHMVYQVWEDGEVTLQKGGDLLWKRSLHTILPGLDMKVEASVFPCQIDSHGYAFVEDLDAAKSVRKALCEHFVDTLRFHASL